MRVRLPVLLTAVAVVVALAPAHASATAVGQDVRVVSGSVSPSTVRGGDDAVQTLELSGPAPEEGLSVLLDGADPAYRSATGSSVRVPAGRTRFSFPVRFSGPPAGAPVTLQLTAFSGGGPEVPAGRVRVLPLDPAVLAVDRLDLSVRSAVEGQTVTATLHLTAPARPGGTGVTVSANSAYGSPAGLDLPPVVVVPGGATSTRFPIGVASVPAPGVSRPSAGLGTSSAAGRLVVVPAGLSVFGGPLERGATTYRFVGIGAATGPATVALRTDLEGVRVPATVQVPAGAHGVRYPITVTGRAPGGATRFGALTAEWRGRTATDSVFH